MHFKMEGFTSPCLNSPVMLSQSRCRYDRLSDRSWSLPIFLGSEAPIAMSSSVICTTDPDFVPHYVRQILRLFPSYNDACLNCVPYQRTGYGRIVFEFGSWWAVVTGYILILSTVTMSVSYQRVSIYLCQKLIGCFFLLSAIPRA